MYSSEKAKNSKALRSRTACPVLARETAGHCISAWGGLPGFLAAPLARCGAASHRADTDVCVWRFGVLKIDEFLSGLAGLAFSKRG